MTSKPLQYSPAPLTGPRSRRQFSKRAIFPLSNRPSTTLSVSTSVWIKLLHAEDPLWATRSASARRQILPVGGPPYRDAPSQCARNRPTALAPTLQSDIA